MRRVPSILLAVVLSWLTPAPGTAVAEKVTLDKPVPVAQKKADKSKINGRIVAYDEDGFDVKGKGDETQTVRWDELDARGVFVVRKSLIGPKDAVAHLELGRILLGIEGGQEWAEKAFALALKIDPGFKGQVDDVREEGPAGAGKAAADDGELVRDEDAPAKDMAEGSAARGSGPKTVGSVDQQYWGTLTDEQQAEALATLKEFAEETKKTMGKELRLYETKYFLLYSDLPVQEAKNWSGLLDRMYAKLAEMFGIEKGVNVWRGKALVFVFAADADYRRFQVAMHQTDPGESDGMCHSYGDGMVHIAFYRQPEELEFAHVLVHESVHGFLHRYKTPVNIPSWANEGLAEWIANQLVPRPGRAQESHRYAKYVLQQHGSLGEFFETDHIVGWQYPVAEMLTTFMIERNKKGYVAFINGLKEGLGVEEALETKYKAPRDRVVDAFARAIGVRLKA
jgi:hypothetical protein